MFVLRGVAFVKGWPKPRPNPAFCRSGGRHHFSEYRTMRRVDHCVRCGAKKLEVLEAQRERQRGRAEKRQKVAARGHE